MTGGDDEEVVHVGVEIGLLVAGDQSANEGPPSTLGESFLWASFSPSGTGDYAHGGEAGIQTTLNADQRLGGTVRPGFTNAALG